MLDPNLIQIAPLTKRQQRRLKKRERYKPFLQSLSCQVCGYQGENGIELHHIDPSTKIAEVARLISGCFSHHSVVAEIAKCAALCSICHKEIHAGMHSSIVLTRLKFPD
jgi:hypothetical protein